MQKKNITSLTNIIIKDIYHQLHDKKSNYIIIESWNIIKEKLYETNNIDYILCTQNWYDNNKLLLNEKYIQNLLIVTQEIINKLSFVETVNEIVIITKLVINNFEINKQNKFLVLDNIQDPTNLATILRTASCFNFNHIFISNNCVKLNNHKVIRGSMGAIFKLKYNFYDDLSILIKQLHKNNIVTIASCLNKEAIKLKDYKKDAYKPFALIMGNESKGIDKNNINLCTYKVYIDIDNMDSLNVSCAFAIFAYWFSFSE